MPVHADLDLCRAEYAGEGLTAELAALISIEDFGLPVPSERFLQRLDAKAR